MMVPSRCEATCTSRGTSTIDRARWHAFELTTTSIGMPTRRAGRPSGPILRTECHAGLAHRLDGGFFGLADRGLWDPRRSCSGHRAGTAAVADKPWRLYLASGIRSGIGAVRRAAGGPGGNPGPDPGADA